MAIDSWTDEEGMLHEIDENGVESISDPVSGEVYQDDGSDEPSLKDRLKDEASERVKRWADKKINGEPDDSEKLEGEDLDGEVGEPAEGLDETGESGLDSGEGGELSEGGEELGETGLDATEGAGLEGEALGEAGLEGAELTEAGLGAGEAAGAIGAVGAAEAAAAPEEAVGLVAIIAGIFGLPEEAVVGIVVGIIVVIVLVVVGAFALMNAKPDSAAATPAPTSRSVTTPANTMSNVPLYKQWDPRWGGDPYGNCGGATIASSGCGATSLAMVISYWTGKKVLPSETAKAIVAHGWRACGQGTSWAALTGLPKIYGLQAKLVSWPEAKKYLEKGWPIIQDHRAGYFTNGGHFIVLTGIQNGKYTINDPDGKHRTTATESQITASMENSWVIWK